MSNELVKEKAIEITAVLIPPEKPRHLPPVLTFAARRPGIKTVAELPEDDPLRQAAEAAKEYADQSQANNTVTAYESDWKHFESWCADRLVTALPTTPSIVALYIAEIAKGWNGEAPKKPSTILRRLAAINAKHKRELQFLPASQKYPEISVVLQGIMRAKGAAQVAKRPVTVKLAATMLHKALTVSPIGIARDKAVLLLGLAGAFRRSELAGVRLEHMNWHREGITIRIGRSKTDQTGKGREVEIPYGSSADSCPVLAVEDWLAVAAIDKLGQGPLLRPVRRDGTVKNKAMNPDSISYIVRKMAESAGLNDKEKKKHLYSGHSLRAGFVTAASDGGATDRQIMRQTGHKSRQMIDRYSRHEQLDRRAAAQKVGF
jgi:integrase